MAFIMIFKEEPEGMAGVMPTIFLFISANSTNECPKTSWYFGACGLSLVDFLISPVILSNKPGACHLVWSFSARAKPFPLTVTQCNNLGPGISFKSLMVAAKRFTSCPSTGPKYLKFKASNKLLCLSKVPLMLFSIFLAYLWAFGPSSESLINTFDTSSRKRL